MRLLTMITGAPAMRVPVLTNWNCFRQQMCTLETVSVSSSRCLGDSKGGRMMVAVMSVVKIVVVRVVAEAMAINAVLF